MYAAGDELMRSITGFSVHRGVLASFDRRPLPAVAEVLRDARRVVVLEDVNNHTNVGAVVRSASALGVDALLLDPASCDPLYRRSLRISMGEALSLPHARTEPLPEGLAPLREAGFVLVALTPDPGAADIAEVAAARHDRLAVLLGTEGAGLSAAVLAEADVRARIPLAAGVDSLNVAAAAAVAFYALRAAAPGLAAVRELLTLAAQRGTRLVAHGEVDRGCDEAERRRLMVQLLGALDHAGLGDCHDGAQHDLLEVPAAVRRLDHHALRRVLVGRDHDPADGAAMQVRQHVALAEGCDEQQLGVPAVGVAAEGRIGRAGDGRSSGARRVVRAVVAAVVGRSLTAVTGPGHERLVRVFAGHAVKLSDNVCHVNHLRAAAIARHLG